MGEALLVSGIVAISRGLFSAEYLGWVGERFLEFYDCDVIYQTVENESYRK